MSLKGSRKVFLTVKELVTLSMLGFQAFLDLSLSLLLSFEHRLLLIMNRKKSILPGPIEPIDLWFSDWRILKDNSVRFLRIFILILSLLIAPTRSLFLLLRD